MSSISGLGSASSALANTATTRSGSRGDRLFTKVDADGSGSVDTSELQTMLDKISKATGTTAGDAAEVMKKADANGDGSLSQDELGEAMKSLRPTDGSTVDFAQRTRPPEGGPPPGPPPDEASGSSSATGSASTDPLDTNGDGTVSASERVAGDLKTLMADLAQATQGSSASSSTASSGTGSGGSGSSSKSEGDFAAMAKMWLQQYQPSASSAVDNVGSSLSVSV